MTGKKKYSQDARAFIWLLRDAVRQNESTRLIMRRAEQCLQYGVAKRTVRKEIRNGFRRHIVLLAHEFALVEIAFVIAKALACMVDPWFLAVSLRVAMNQWWTTPTAVSA